MFSAAGPVSSRGTGTHRPAHHRSAAWAPTGRGIVFLGTGYAACLGIFSTLYSSFIQGPARTRGTI